MPKVPGLRLRPLGHQTADSARCASALEGMSPSSLSPSCRDSARQGSSRPQRPPHLGAIVFDSAVAANLDSADAHKSILAGTDRPFFRIEPVGPIPPGPFLC